MGLKRLDHIALQIDDSGAGDRPLEPQPVGERLLHRGHYRRDRRHGGMGR